MPPMTPANYISIGALAISVIMMVYNIYNGNKTQGRADDAEQARNEERTRVEQERTTSMQLTLNSINQQLTKIENSINTVQKDTRDNHDQLIILQQSLKSEHKRLDDHEKRLHDLERESRATSD